MLTVHKIGTTEEWADILTKAIAKEDSRYFTFRDAIMNAAAGMRA